MHIDYIPDNFDITVYNAVASHPLQSWEWGEARKKMGIEVIRLGEFSNERDSLTNIFQLTIHPIPHTPYKIGYLPRSVWPSQETLTKLQKLAAEKKIIFIKLEPYILKQDFSLENNQSELKIAPSSHALFPEWTLMLDISPSENELLQNMKPKTRYNIRLAEKKGVTVKELSNSKGFEIFSKLYFDTTHRQKYYGHTHEYHRIVWETLQKNIAHILIAFYGDIPLAAYELFNFNKTFYYPYGGSSEQHRNLMGANLLMWEAIKIGKKLGCEKFDMWGSLAPEYNQNNPWAGFTRFKEGYNAQFTHLAGSFDLVVNPFMYSVYNSVHKIRDLYLKLKV